MSDEISKVVRFRCPKCDAPEHSRERRPNGNSKCVNGHGYPSREAIESATAPVGVDAVAEGGDMDADAWAELHRLRADAIESVSGLPWRQLAAQLRVERATLARQLAEAKAEVERLDAECRQHMTQALNNGQAALQAESALAAATRRVAEVEEVSELRKVAKRNLRSLIERSSSDKELMLKCLEELS